VANNSSRLKKRSLISAYFEAARLYITNFHRYIPAVVGPAFLLFLLEQGKVAEHWLENPSVAGFVVLFIDLSTVFLLSGILGHITSHIYIGHKTDTWKTLGSALRLVPAEFAAGFISALPAVLVILAILKGGSNELGLLVWVPILWAVSIVSSIVVEAEGIKNPFRAIWRAFQLVFAKDKHFSNSLRIVGVVFINFVVITVLAKGAWVKLVLKLSVEPVFEIVYGLLYFNLRFQEGPFDVTVLAKQLASESQRPAEVAAAG
jgi:hypothetical protein